MRLQRGDDIFPARISAPSIETRGLREALPPKTECVAIVGSRAATEYGLRVTRTLTREFVNAGLTVVSGGALGIDINAHAAAMVEGGNTIVVLPSGVHNPQPRTNMDIFSEVLGASGDSAAPRGWLVSQFEAEAVPTRERYFARNLTIAELSGAVVVIEAGIRSGSMNTVSQAYGAGIPVFAVPGPVTSAQSVGCHEAIRKGFARICVDATDVINTVKGV